MAEKFTNALSTIKDALVDFSQLNVRTFVGAVDIDTGGSGDPDWDALMRNAVTQGSIKLAASTTLRIDGDADYFEDPDRMTDGLRSAHNDAVKAGQEARNAILNSISSRVQDLIK